MRTPHAPEDEIREGLADIPALPVVVHSWHVEEVVDAGGDPAFKVTAHVDPDVSQEALESAYETIWETAMHLRPDDESWVYLTFAAGDVVANG